MYSSISGIKNTHRKNVYNYANVDFPKEAIEEMFAKLHKISKDVSRLAPNRAVRAGEAGETGEERLVTRVHVL